MKLALILPLLLSVPTVVRQLGVPGTTLEWEGWAGSTRAPQGSQFFIVQCFVANWFELLWVRTAWKQQFPAALPSPDSSYGVIFWWVAISFCLHALFPCLLQISSHMKRCLSLHQLKDISPGCRGSEAGVCTWRATEVQLRFAESNFGQESVTLTPNQSVFDGPAPLFQPS